MNQSVLDAKHQVAQRKFRAQALLIIPFYAAGVGALAAFIAASYVLQQPGDALPWAGVGAFTAAALVSVSLLFTLAPATPDAPAPRHPWKAWTSHDRKAHHHQAPQPSHLAA